MGLRFCVMVSSVVLHYSTCFCCCLSSSYDPAVTVFGHVFVCLIICVFEYLSICVWKTGWGFVCFCYPVGWEFETWVSSSMVRALPTRRRVIPWWPHVRLPGTGRCRRRPLFENLIICQTLACLRLIIWCSATMHCVIWGIFSLSSWLFWCRYMKASNLPSCHCIGWFEPYHYIIMYIIIIIIVYIICWCNYV